MQYILPEELVKDLTKATLYPEDTASFEMPHAETDIAKQVYSLKNGEKVKLKING
jgi:hypothetical protein